MDCAAIYWIIDLGGKHVSTTQRFLQDVVGRVGRRLVCSGGNTETGTKSVAIATQFLHYTNCAFAAEFQASVEQTFVLNVW